MLTNDVQTAEFLTFLYTNVGRVLKFHPIGYASLESLSTSRPHSVYTTVVSNVKSPITSYTTALQHFSCSWNENLLKIFQHKTML